MAYISKSCDLARVRVPKKEIVMADISRSCDLLGDGDSKNRKFDGLCKQHFCSKNSKNIQKIV